MDKKSLLAIVLSIFILVVYQELVSYLYPPPQHAPQAPQPLTQSAPTVSPQSVTGEGAHITGAKEASSSLKEAMPSVRNLTVENDVYSAVLTSLGGRLQSVRLKKYPGDAGRDSPLREMVVEGT